MLVLKNNNISFPFSRHNFKKSWILLADLTEEIIICLINCLQFICYSRLISLFSRRTINNPSNEGKGIENEDNTK